VLWQGCPEMNETTFDRRLLLWALVPALSYGLVYFLLDNERPMPLFFELVPFSQFAEKGAEEAQRRYVWLSTFALLTVVCIGVAASTGAALARETLRRDRWLVFGIVGGLVSLVLADVYFQVLGQRWHTFLGDGLYERIFKLVAAAGYPSAFEQFLLGKEVIKAATISALIVLSFAMIATLKKPPAGLSRAVKAKVIGAAIARQRVFLNQAALVYVFAVVAMLSWMYWPLPYLTEAAAQDYRKVLTGAAALQGVGFTLGVAAVYLTPAFILRARAESLASEILLHGGSDTQIAHEIGPLAAHPFDHLRQVMTMVMPVIVSLLPAIRDTWMSVR
jgi:hypothetical protein